MNSSLVLKDVCYAHYESNILNKVSLHVNPGQLFSICGENGSGKSTCLKIIAGLLEPSSGQLLYPTNHQFNNLIGYVGHKTCLDGALSSVQHFKLDLAINQTLADSQILEQLKTWGIDQQKAFLPVQFLSAGQKKRLCFALLQSKQAYIWLLDEPHINLDKKGQAYLEAAIEAHLKSGGIVVQSLHQASSQNFYELSN